MSLISSGSGLTGAEGVETAVSAKVLPLEVVLVEGKLCVKALKFETIENELKGISTWEALLMERSIVTDVNNNIVSVKKLMTSYQQNRNRKGLPSREELYKDVFETYLCTIKYKVYIVVYFS